MTDQELILPPNFKQMIVECLDPLQSCEYAELGGKTFLVQVLPVGIEKKIIRLGLGLQQDYEMTIIRCTGEIVTYLEKTNSYDWPVNNCRLEDMEAFYLSFMERLQFNDYVVDVVQKIIRMIDWKPTDDRSKEDSNKYYQSRVFLPVTLYLNLTEKMTHYDILRNVTRGMLEIMKLNNMISNDRMKFVDKQKEEADSIGKEMSSAKTADEFMAGLAKQGFSLGNLI